MDIFGKLVPSTPIQDWSPIRVVIFETDSLQGRSFAAQVAADGTFRAVLDNAIAEQWQQLFIAVFMANSPVKIAGPFKRERWQEIVIDGFAINETSNRAESPDIVINGRLVDTASLVNAYSQYKVKLRYKRVDAGGVLFEESSSVEVFQDGLFVCRIMPDLEGQSPVDQSAPLLFQLLDNKQTEIPFTTFVVFSGQRDEKPTITLMDLTKKIPAMRLEATAEAGRVELQFRSTAAPHLPVSATTSKVPGDKRVKGKVVDKLGKIKVRNCQVIVYAKIKADANNEAGASVPIFVVTTDGEGNFSAPYPTRTYSEASAIVVVKPDEIKEIPLESDGGFPDFVWLILETLPPSITQEKHDDCACTSGSTPFLPDMEDLLHNSAYAQDIGGSCVNFTTPNRALEEFSYKLVVRTSDPDLFDLDEETLRGRRKEIANRVKFLERQLGFTDILPVSLQISQQMAAIINRNISQSTQSVRSQEASDVTSSGNAQRLSGGFARAVTSPGIHETLAAQQFLGQTVYNRDVKVLRSELASLKSQLKKVDQLLAHKGRLPLTGKDPIDWDDSDHTLGVVQASTIAYGHILNYKQVWRAAGYSLGDLTYSLPLAPGQKKQIAMFDWDRKETATRTDALDYNDRLANSMSHERDIQDIVKSTLNESIAASSHNKSEGSSFGAGIGGGTSSSAAGAGSYAGFSVIGAASSMFGLSGGANKSEGESWSEASQNSMRNLAASSNQRLRDSTMQNASSLRSQRSSVVTTVGQSESFKITTEVVANHNHCHAVTIQYFEVLRHYAIHQELADVQECIFVPLLIEGFGREKILRWRDILSTYLLAPGDKWAALHSGFDALQRQQDELEGDPDAYADFPLARYADESLTDLFGNLKLQLHIVRPSETLVDESTATLQQRKDALIKAFEDNGLSWLSGFRDIAERLINQEKEKIEENFQKELLWGQAADEYVKNIEVYATMAGDSSPQYLHLDVSLVSKVDTGVNHQNKDASRFGYFDLVVSLRATQRTPRNITRAQIQSLIIRNRKSLPRGSFCILKGGSMQYRTDHNSDFLFASDFIDNDIAFGDDALVQTPLNKSDLRNPRKEDRKNASMLVEHLNTNREHYHTKIWMLLDEQRLFNLLDKYIIPVPKLRYASGMKTGVDKYGLVLDQNGQPVIDYEERSVASVVELKRIGMAGNSMIFPVARGLNLNRDFLLIPEFDVEDSVDIPDYFAFRKLGAAPGDDEQRFSRIGLVRSASRLSLVDLYKPLPGTKEEPKPFRISVPTKGLFAEAVAGACNSCEKIDDTRFWKWEEHPIDEPTAIQPISTDTRRAAPSDTAAKDFPAPMINIQAAPAAPDPQGLANAFTLLGKSDIFKDMTGLDQTQKNALQSLLSNQEAAKFLAAKAAELAIESGRQTQHAADTVASYDLAKQGKNMQMLDKIKDLPLDADTKQKYIDNILGDKTNAGDVLAKNVEHQMKREETQDTSKQEAEKKVDEGVGQLADTLSKRLETDANVKGTVKKGDTEVSFDQKPSGDKAFKYDFIVPGTITPIQQPSSNACWATVSAIMYNWKNKSNKDPKQVITEVAPDFVNFIDTGLPIDKIGEFNKTIGFKSVSANTNFPASVYYELLQKYGPVWIIDLESADPKSLHGRVLIGIKGDDSSPDTKFIFVDPANSSKYDEALPDFVKKTEAVVRTLAAIPNSQIPLAIHFADTYDQNRFQTAIVGNGGGASPSGNSSFSSPILQQQIESFKKVFQVNPQILSYGQFIVTNSIRQVIMATIQQELIEHQDPDVTKLKDVFEKTSFLNDRDISTVKKRLEKTLAAKGILDRFSNTMALFKIDPSLRNRNWPKRLISDFWHDDKITALPWLEAYTFQTHQLAFFAEKSLCYDVARSVARKYFANTSGLSVPNYLRINDGAIAGASVSRLGMEIIFKNKDALPYIVDKMGDVIAGGGMLLGGTLSGSTHANTGKKFPDPEHYLLIFAKESNRLLFWDSDSAATEISQPNWPATFGLLFQIEGHLSTGFDGNDLFSFNDNSEHLQFPKRHRYQVYHVATLSR
jgi:hypothetical protein